MGSWQRSQAGHVALLSLARPPVNALDRAALEELDANIADLEADADTRVLVVTGGLDDIFCVGGDLKCWRAVRDARAVSRAGDEVFRRIERLGLPTVAAINGRVIGDGLALALACDLRIASGRATFRLPETAYGFIPGWGSIRRLVSCVGRAHAANLLLTGRPIGAARAERIGLVHHVVSPGRLVRDALDRGAELAAFSSPAMSAAKCVLHGGDERACFAKVWGGADWQEGIDALMEKRTPAFAPREAADPGCCTRNGFADRQGKAREDSRDDGSPA